jgi:hypothetical protein
MDEKMRSGPAMIFHHPNRPLFLGKSDVFSIFASRFLVKCGMGEGKK